MSTEIDPHNWFPEPKLSFHPERTTDVDPHPLRGLLKYGPYSSNLVPDPIRVATIAPFGKEKELYGFMRELNSRYSPQERKDYLHDWPGFKSVFGVQMKGADSGCHIVLDKSVDVAFEKSPAPHLVLAEHLTRALQMLETRRTEFDVVFLHLPLRWEEGFKGAKDDDFDLHDHIKAFTAARRIPVQIVREDRAIAYRNRCSVMWRIGLALYAKAGGVPWKLSDADPETAHIGISYALRPVTSDRPRFVTCCSQVFDSGGSGLEFVAYDADEVDIHRDNPFLSRTEMFRVMTRSMDLYRRRHAGKVPKRLIVHKSTEFKRDEIDGCMEAFHLCESVDLIQVVNDVGWRGVKMEKRRDQKKGTPAGFPVERGSLVGIGPRDALLWIHGDVKGVSSRGASFFQGSRSTPQPIRLVRHAGHGPWDQTALSALQLSKMNWNNDALYDQLPVTMGFAQLLARVVKRMSGLGSRPYQFRFFM